MGVIAESFVSYGQPLIDPTDGSESQMQRAMDIAQMCWNLAILPEDQRDATIDKFPGILGNGGRRVRRVAAKGDLAHGAAAYRDVSRTAFALATTPRRERRRFSTNQDASGRATLRRIQRYTSSADAETPDGGPQRTLSVRERTKIQEVLRRTKMTPPGKGLDNFGTTLPIK
jgi:hypothetical protein